MTPQSTFNIVARIRAGRLEALRTLLVSMNQHPGFADPRNALVPYWQLPQLHFARFTILEANTNDDIRAFGIEPRPWPAALCFIGDVDGDAVRFLAELVIRAEPGLRQIFGHCEDLDDSTDLLQWLRAHDRRPAANYVNWRGRTVRQVREEAALATALGIAMDAHRTAEPPLPPAAIQLDLRARVAEEVAAGRLTLTPPEPTPAGWRLRELANLIGVPLVLLAFAPLFLVLAPSYVYRLRQLEESDPDNRELLDPDHVRTLVAQEDVDVSNHFNVFGQVKPGLLRRFTIRLGLLLVDYGARHVYGRGYLTRVQTIHFARWVMLDGDRRVFFASNYDGSEDSYMDDFINKVAWGLNLVFGNGVGYPRCRWLIHGGAKFEQQYKRTLRRNQLPSGSWYKAYPGLTAVDLARNARIRRGLEAHDPGDARIREWLALL
jgi:hypothetical protein